ncbi:MAG TPA: hypothetical protein DCS24_02545 [Erythrobacter sp.]|nr:hypothetical protein [Erythrobacter sp.]
MAVSAIWRGHKIATATDTIVVEGNHYFDPKDVDRNVLVESEISTHCPWKGDASYYSIRIGGEINQDAAWYYPDPKEAALQIKDRIAFWRGVEVKES